MGLSGWQPGNETDQLPERNLPGPRSEGKQLSGRAKWGGDQSRLTGRKKWHLLPVTSSLRREESPSAERGPRVILESLGRVANDKSQGHQTCDHTPVCNRVGLRDDDPLSPKVESFFLSSVSRTGHLSPLRNIFHPILLNTVRSQADLGLNPGFPITSYVFLGKSVNLSEPLIFFHLSNGENTFHVCFKFE